MVDGWLIMAIKYIKYFRFKLKNPLTQAENSKTELSNY